MSEGTIFVQVSPLVDAGREIGWDAAARVTEELSSRVADVRLAIASAASAVAEGLPTLPAVPGWNASEISATFGVTLTAEAGALITKASAGATFEVSITFKRHELHDASDASAHPG